MKLLIENKQLGQISPLTFISELQKLEMNNFQRMDGYGLGQSALHDLA